MTTPPTLSDALNNLRLQTRIHQWIDRYSSWRRNISDVQKIKKKKKEQNKYINL